MCETQCDMLSVAHLFNRQVHPCCHLNCSTLASQTGRLLEDETVTVWYAEFIYDELIWDELVLFLQVKHSQEWVEQERQKTAFLFLSIFRMVCTLYLCAIVTGALRVTWIDGCAFTEHVNNCRQLLHFVANREHRRLWGKVSQHDLNCSFLCSVIFSDKTFSTLYYFSCFHLFHWKVLVRGEFH